MTLEKAQVSPSGGASPKWLPLIRLPDAVILISKWAAYIVVAGEQRIRLNNCYWSGYPWPIMVFQCHCNMFLYKF